MTQRLWLLLCCLSFSLFGPSAIAAPPTNDNFADATVLAGETGTLTQSTAEATLEAGEPEHLDSDGSATVWFTWQAAADGALRVTTADSDFDTFLSVYQGETLDSLTLVGSDDDSDGNTTSALRFAVSAGAIYQIVAGGYQGATGSLTLSWEPTTLPTPATVATGAVSDLGRSRFTVAANLLTAGDSAVTLGVCLSTTPGPTIADSVADIAEAPLGTSLLEVVGLTGGTQYFVRAYAENEAGVAYGEEITVTTLPRLLLQYRVSGSVSDLGGGTEVKRKVTGVLLTGLEESITVLLLTWKEGKIRRYQVQDWREDLALSVQARLKRGEHYALASTREVFAEEDETEVLGLLTRQFNGKTSAVKLSKGAAAQDLPKLLKGGEARLDQGGAKLGRSSLTARLDTKATAALQASETTFDAAFAALQASVSTGATLAPEPAFGTGAPAAPDHAGLVVYRWRSNFTDYGQGSASKERDWGYLVVDPSAGLIYEAYFVEDEEDEDDSFWDYDSWTEDYIGALYQATGKRGAKQQVMGYSELDCTCGPSHSLGNLSVVGKMTPRVNLGGGLLGTIAKSLNGQYFNADSDFSSLTIGSYTLRLDVKETKYANDNEMDIDEYIDEWVDDFDF